MAISSFAFAAPAIKPGEIPTNTQLGITQASPVTSVSGLVGILAGVVRWTYTIFFVIAVMFILFSAYSFLTSGGEPEKVKSAREKIMWAAVAIAIALLAVGAEVIIKNFLISPIPGGAPSTSGGGITPQEQRQNLEAEGGDPNLPQFFNPENQQVP